MVRAPCCEKMGLKKGPWTPEEDQILINYIKFYGHGNWRALPKLAGLLRCGKSCRLRWTNYLRPDIKRGNFTREEEDTIIRLHEMLGNRWSAIAAKLPGRTDNEIKNVWHTHLKRRLKQNHHSRKQQEQEQKTKPVNHVIIRSSESTANPVNKPLLLSPPQQEYSSDMSSLDSDHNNSQIINTCMNKMPSSLSENLVEIDDNFWSEVLSADNSSIDNDFSAVGTDPLANAMEPSSTVNDFSSNNNLFESMDYWYNLFTRAEESLELPEI